jgi:hypothetical protein
MKTLLTSFFLVSVTWIYSQCILTNNISVTPTSDSISCNGGIIVTTTGGTAPYTYLWNTGNTSNSNSLSNLCPGTYTVTVVDANGCSSSISGSVTIATNPCDSLTASVSVQQSSMNACDGSVSIWASGGISPYNLTLSGNGMTVTGAGNVGGGSMFGNLCPGTYNYQIIDANGCSYSNTISITTNNNPCANFGVGFSNVTNASSPAICDGSVSANVYGGTAPYSYVWNNGLTTNSANNLCQGNYVVCVTDMNGCQVCDSITIYDSTNVNCNGFTASLSIINVSMAGTCDGSIIPVVSGGTSPYVYLWSNGSTTENQTSLCEGLYNVTIYDANGCMVASSGYVGNSSGNLGDTIILNGNISIDSTVIGTISGNWIDNCTFDFNTVTDAYISSYVDLVDSTIVTWTLLFNDGTSTTVNATYLFSPGTTGIYNVVLQLYCGLKSNPQWLIAYAQMFYEGLAGFENLNKNNLVLFPNPADNTVNILGLNESSSYQIIDGFGRMVIEKMNSSSIDISELQNGIYTLIITGNNQNESIRFVKH